MTQTFQFVARGHLAAVSGLCEARADVDRAARGEATPVFVASLNGHPDVVRCLGAFHADVDRPPKTKDTTRLNTQTDVCTYVCRAHTIARARSCARARACRHTRARIRAGRRMEAYAHVSVTIIIIVIIIIIIIMISTNINTHDNYY